MAKKRFNQEEIVADIAAYVESPIERPTQPSSIEHSAHYPELTAHNSEPKSMGRPKKTRRVIDGAPMSIFFTNELKKKLESVKFYQKIDMKELIAGSTVIFLEKYYENGVLSDTGQAALERALKKFYGG